MPWRTLVALALAVFLSVAGTALVSGWYFGRTVFPDGVVVTTMHSVVLGEEREVIVHLPESYAREGERRYPVIYVLDGSSQDLHTATSAALMARIGLMPELIVVGLSNVSGPGRQRDYTPPDMAMDEEDPSGPRGRGDRFLAFVKTEVIPAIDQRYRTSDVRMLHGYSRGGLLVAYSLIAEPELFQARFAHSPAWWRDETMIAGGLAEYFAAHQDASGYFYMSMGTDEVPRMKEAFERVRILFATSAPPALRWQADFVPGAVHANNSERATPLGFRALYRDDAGEASRESK
jgi:hypothetical protein